MLWLCCRNQSLFVDSESQTIFSGLLMDVVRLPIPDVILLTPEKKSDNRGFFSEVYNQKKLHEIGVSETFVQDNHSLSRHLHVVRGLHFQKPPCAQGKLIRVISGSILDIALDIRPASPTFGKHVSALLSAENWRQLWIPKGFAHGFCTLEKNTEVVYKVTESYSPKDEIGIKYNDPSLGIDWKLPENANPILSTNDQENLSFAEAKEHFA